MEATDFNAILRAEGFPEAIRRSLPAGQVAPDHAHDFDAKALILAGAFTVTKDGIATTHRPGDLFAVPAGYRHAEQVGPDGVEYLSARRQPAG
jgi:quercetin dioxygenase-like cupin family protein